MPRPKNRVPSLTRHKSTGQARCRWDGNDHYFGPFGEPETEERFRRWAGELLTTGTAPDLRRRRADEPAPDDPAGVTVSELIARYRRHCLDYYRDPEGGTTGEVDQVRLSLKPVRETYGTTPAAAFGPKRLKAVREIMVRSGLCRREVNKRVGRVKRMFKWGVAEELLPPTVRHGLDAVEGLKRGRTEARETKPVPPAPEGDVNAVLPRLPRPVAAMVKLQLLTGMRPGEAIRLRPSEVNRDGAVWEYAPTRHKTQYRGKSRTVMIGPRAQAVLGPFLDDRPAEAFAFSPREAVAEVRARRRAERTTPESCGNRPGTNRKATREKEPGESYTTNTYGRAIERACKAAGVPKWTPNQLRHTNATMVRREFGLEAAQVVLGHSAADVTQVYAERDLSHARRVAAEVG